MDCSMMEMRILLTISFLFDVASGSETSDPTLQTASFKPLYTKEHLSKEAQILSTTSPSKLSCAGACSSIIECKAFSFNGKAGFCQLYKKGPKTSCRSTEPDRRVYYVRVQTHGTTKLQPDQPNDTSHYFLPGSIVLANLDARSSLSQLTLGREKITVNTYLFIKPMEVISMQCSSILQSLFISQPIRNILSIRLRKKRTSVIRNGPFSTLSVDGKQCLLFAVGDTSEIYRMTTQGKLLKRLHHSPQHISVLGLTIDSKHALVYFSLFHHSTEKSDVFSMKYTGGDCDILFERTKGPVRNAVFDQTFHTLLHTHNNKLMSYDLSAKEHNHSVLTTLDLMSGIAIYQGTLYYVDRNSLVEFRYKMGKTKTLAGLPGNHFYDLCFIN